MLLPIGTNPKISTYYCGAMVLNVLKNVKNRKINLMDLYLQLNKEEKMSFSQVILALDWLYLIDVVEMNNEGVVYCI